MVGGGGERQTLRIVAKYADACNLFGSPETVRRKLGILREHCKSLGRNYDTILKTKLGHIIIEKDRQKLNERVAKVFGSIPEQMRREWATFGQPEEVARQIESLRDEGIDYYISNFDPEHELEDLRLFAGEVVRRF
jgi:alkanesulfonate monooxygenase SsuD/methylene tetrahydromethanopterin reductase-like flavin-dependent oxidoreductase (luciferase family)